MARMPYVVCPNCGVRTYTAAHHSTEDTCPRCDYKLARSPGIDARVARREKRFWRNHPQQNARVG